MVENEAKAKEIDRLNEKIGEKSGNIKDIEYTGISFNDTKDYKYKIFPDLDRLSEKEKDLSDFNTTDLNREIERLREEKESLEKELEDDRFKEIAPFKREESPEKDRVIDDVKKSYKKSAYEEVGNKLSKINLIGGYVGLVVIIALCVVLYFFAPNYFWTPLLGLFGLIIPFVSIYKNNKAIDEFKSQKIETEGIDPTKIWAISTFDDCNRIKKEIDDKEKDIKLKKQELENHNKDVMAFEEEKGDFFAQNLEFSDYKGYILKELLEKAKLDYGMYKDFIANEKLKSDIKKWEDQFIDLLAEFGFGNYNDFKIIFDKLGDYKEAKRDYEVKEKNYNDLKNDFPDYSNLSEDKIKEYKDNLSLNKEEKVNKTAKNQQIENDKKEKEKNSNTQELLRKKEMYTDKLKKYQSEYLSQFTKFFMSGVVKEKSGDFVVDIKNNTRNYFNLFAAGKYEMDEEGNITEIYTGNIINRDEINKLSSGTYCQLLLAAKIAVIENQEKDIKYPLFLDESLASVDDESTKAVIEALEKIDRQVFYFSPKKYTEDEWNKAVRNKDNIETFDIDKLTKVAL